jgi:hypothetical protein
MINKNLILYDRDSRLAGRARATATTSVVRPVAPLWVELRPGVISKKANMTGTVAQCTPPDRFPPPPNNLARLGRLRRYLLAGHRSVLTMQANVTESKHDLCHVGCICRR